MPPQTFPDAPPHVCVDHAYGPVYGWLTTQGFSALRLPLQSARRSTLPMAAFVPDLSLASAVETALKRYFTGILEDFSQIPLDLGNATSFQREVWMAAREIAWGQTVTYGQLADRLGRGSASARAVGTALGANPLLIVIPCHRIVAEDGGLVDFAAGVQWKAELLRLEGTALC